MALDGSFQRCIEEVRQAHGEGATDDDALNRLDEVDQRATRLQRRSGLSREDALRGAASQLSDEEAIAAAVERRNALQNLQKRMARRERIARNAGVIQQANETGVGPAIKRGVNKLLGKKPAPMPSADVATALRNDVVAIATPVQGGRYSAEAVWKTRVKEYTGLIAELKNAGLLETVRRGDNERNWVRELYERSMVAAGEDGKPGVTGDKQAGDIADIFHRYQSLAKERLNREGAWIGDYAGYVTRTAHDPDTIRRAGLETWKRDISDGLDEKTFDGVDNRDKMLGDTFHNLMTGVHLSDEGGVGFKDPAFVGPSNLARKASAERVLHFKDADAWYAYQKKYGTGTIFEQLLGGLDRSARQEALLQRWGTNPRAEFENDIRYFQEELKGKDPEAVLKLKDAEKSLMALFGRLDGRDNMPAHRLAAQISGSIRTVKSMASLGAVAFTHLSAGVTKAAELRYQGVPALQRYNDFFASIARGRGRGETRQLMDLLRAGTEGMHGHILNKFEPDDTVPGTLSKIANRFFSATGLTYLLDAQKAGAMYVMARHLGSLVNLAHDELPPEVQRGLSQYDISSMDWDRLRTAPDHITDDGRVFLTPDAAHRSTMEGATDASRDALALKLQAYYSDVADRSIVTPGIADRNVLLGNTAPGSIAGEALRFVSQFKTWGIAATRQGLGRELYGGQGLAGAASGVFQMAAGAALLGYAVMTLKDLTSGLNPRDPSKTETWMAAVLQGGGFGILGDYLFGQYSRVGGDVGSSILGPVLGEGVTNVIDIWNDLKSAPDDPKQRQLKDLGPQFLNMAKSWTPFINLFYTRMLTNYLFVHALQEWMNPGYLRRHEQVMKRQQGRTYWLSPAKAQREGLAAAVQAPSFSH